MLTAGHRIRRRVDFADTVRRGRRAARPTLVVHLLAPADLVGAGPLDTDPSTPPARAGFVVSRSVGNSVVRHRVTRQLRHLVADRLPGLVAGSLLVVRALPPAAGASAQVLAHDLDRALARAVAAPSRGTVGVGSAP